MPTTDERGIVSKSKLTALANKIKAAAGESGSFTLDELAALDISGGGGGDTIALSATFDAGENKIFTTDALDDLKQYLTVVVTVAGSTVSTYPLSGDAYTLSGTLAAWSNTITVTFLDKTATFTVSGVIAAEDLTPAITAFNNSNTNYIVRQDSKDILAYHTSTGAWRCVQTGFTSYTGGYRYRLTVFVDYWDGQVIIGMRNSSNSLILSSGTAVQESGMLVLDSVLSDTTSLRISLFSTWSASTYKGNVIFSKIKLIRYQEVN